MDSKILWKDSRYTEPGRCPTCGAGIVKFTSLNQVSFKCPDCGEVVQIEKS